MLPGVLNLNLVNVYGQPVAEKVDIFMRHTVLSDAPVFRGIDASGTIAINNLRENPQGTYTMEVDAPSYQVVSQFVTIVGGPPTEETFTLPVDHNKVVWVDFPKFDAISGDGQALLNHSSNVLGFGTKSGQDLYNAFDDIRRAGYLNLIAKSGRTKLGNSQTVLSYIKQLTEVRGDRFFAVVDPALHGETQHAVISEIFHPVDDALHTPPPGYDKVDSFKTFDHYGNLQLTFSATPDRSSWQVDMDIDDAQGFEHIFQVIRNIAGPTHPYDIHEILIASQELDPGYKLMLHPAEQAAGAV